MSCRVASSTASTKPSPSVLSAARKVRMFSVDGRCSSACGQMARSLMTERPVMVFCPSLMMIGAVVQFHEEHQIRLAQSFANHAFELWIRRRSRCPFRERNYVRMAYCGFNRGQYLVEWPGRVQTESLDLHCGYHPDPL